MAPGLVSSSAAASIRWCVFFLFFFFNDTATTEIYTVYNTLSLHDALPIWAACSRPIWLSPKGTRASNRHRSEEHTSELQSLYTISYAVFCLKKKKKLSFPGPLKYTRSTILRQFTKPNSTPFFFFNDPATTDIYTVYNTLSLHDALPIYLTDDDDVAHVRLGKALELARK